MSAVPELYSTAPTVFADSLLRSPYSVSG